MSPAVSLALVVCLAAGDRAQEIKAERAGLERRLETQKAALALLDSQKVGVLEVLEVYQGLAARVRRRAAWARRQTSSLEARLSLAELEESVAREALRAELVRISPRLNRMYRLTRRSPLEVLLPAKDFTALVWRSRAFSALMREDLALLGEAERVAEYQADAVVRLGELKGTLQARLDSSRAEAAEARAREADLEDALTLIQAKARASGRLARELKASDQQLGRLVEELAAAPQASGFGALKGRLPLPVDGTVEVGFGNVVNPRFNTVTVQKGLDIRAPEGAPVRAVAAGRVVYAAFMHGYGNILILDHGGGYHTLMAHLSELERAVGDTVAPGEVLGRVGDTGSLKGAYLYFELRQKGLAVDPAPWMGRAAGR